LTSGFKEEEGPFKFEEEKPFYPCLLETDFKETGEKEGLIPVPDRRVVSL